MLEKSASIHCRLCAGKAMFPDPQSRGSNELGQWPATLAMTTVDHQMREKPRISAEEDVTRLPGIAQNAIIFLRPRPHPFGNLVRDDPVYLKEAQMAWFLLIIAGLLEIVWAFSMKQSEGFTRLGATSVTLVAMVFSFGLLSWSMRTLPLGTAYTIWTGIGAVGAFVVGIVFLHEPMSAMRILAATLIIGGLVLMKLSS